MFPGGGVSLPNRGSHSHKTGSGNERRLDAAGPPRRAREEVSLLDALPNYLSPGGFLPNRGSPMCWRPGCRSRTG